MFAASRTLATRCFRSFSTTTLALDAAKTTTAAAAAPSPAPAKTASVTKPLPAKTYFVERTKSGQLPVYSEFRNAGTRELVIVRKIQGNAGALRTDFLLTFPGAEIRVNDRSNQLVFRDLHIDDIRQWLTIKGF
ncbi:mitochondrial large subunit ribosomal protein-domain-containing protein [Mortierella sp. GBAus27b]|nr:hypothetical protein BGX31_001716 [Mortierella sp. GBA43]KAI8363759.1 mitochondrial large subunit ribosomal protein-domain-containing protein [Mortierella sp. GBAus27b]